MPDWFNEPDVDLKLNPLKKPNINGILDFWNRK